MLTKGKGRKGEGNVPPFPSPEKLRERKLRNEKGRILEGKEGKEII